MSVKSWYPNALGTIPRMSPSHGGQGGPGGGDPDPPDPGPFDFLDESSNPFLTETGEIITID